jgi:hypothetical protein
MPLPPVLTSIIGWLRAGYPDGVPEHDYVPLFALLGRRLTADELAELADELASESDPDRAQAIRSALLTQASQLADDADIARVRSRLALGGWPLAPISESP